MATEQTQTASELREVSERWMRGWNEKDVDVLVAQLADDLRYWDPAWPDVMTTADDVRRFTDTMWSAMPDMHFSEPLGLFPNADGTAGCVPWHMTATFSGELDPPGYAPTGDRIAVDGVDVFELRDGKIARLSTYYDQMTIARSLGVLPERGSRGERAGVRLQKLLAKRRRR